MFAHSLLLFSKALEAGVQAASYALARLLYSLEFPPLLRMMAVAIWHPRHPRHCKLSTTSLQTLVEDDHGIFDDDCADDTTIQNRCRHELTEALMGNYGEWRFLTAASVLEQSLLALDPSTLTNVGVLPGAGGKGSLPAALSEFLAAEYVHKSNVSGAGHIRDAGIYTKM